MKKSVLFLLLIAALGIAATVSARVAIGTLSGTVLDADGKPVDYATVTLQTSDGNHPHLTRTDGDGHFEFTRFETGQYDVRGSVARASSIRLAQAHLHSLWQDNSGHAPSTRAAAVIGGWPLLYRKSMI